MHPDLLPQLFKYDPLQPGPAVRLLNDKPSEQQEEVLEALVQQVKARPEPSAAAGGAHAGDVSTGRATSSSSVDLGPKEEDAHQGASSGAAGADPGSESSAGVAGSAMAPAVTLSLTAEFEQYGAGKVDEARLVVSLKVGVGGKYSLAQHSIHDIPVYCCTVTVQSEKLCYAL